MTIHHAGDGERASAQAASRRTPLALVVDDDPNTLHLLVEVIRASGWQARGFGHLAALRRVLPEVDPDLVLVDDDLPDGRGGDFARQLREDEATRDLEIVVCTGAQPIRRAEIGSWAPVITKPFDIGTIERLLENAQRPSDSADRSMGRAS